MIEIELKIKVDKAKAKELVKALAKNVYQPRTKETTTMYDDEEQLMLITDGRLRIRTGFKNSVSYKKPITRKGIKREIEYESEIENPSEVVKIFNMMGFGPVSGYTRFRTIWKINGVKVFLDEFSFGLYVEVEGEEKTIRWVANQLGLDLKENITDSYDGIYKKLCEAKGVKPNPFMS